MASYSLIGSYATVQVISSTLVLRIQYCTIQTEPSKVIASIAIAEADFKGGTANVLLGDFADAIETIMNHPEVIAGVGSQTIDENGLLEDNVVFTVQYVGPTTPASGVTTEAVVPVGLLNFTDGAIGALLLQQVDAIIAAAYNALKAAAGG